MKKYILATSFILLIPSVIAADGTVIEDAPVSPAAAASVSAPDSDRHSSSPLIEETPVASPVPSKSLLPAMVPEMPQALTPPTASSAQVAIPHSDLPTTVDSGHELTQLKSDRDNFETKGGMPILGIFGEQALKEEAVKEKITHLSQLYNDSRGHSAALERQLNVANEGLKDVDAIRRALKETQERLDKEKAEKDALVDKLRAVEARAKFLKDAEEKLLLEADKKDAAMALEKARKDFLEKENLRLRKIIAELEANAKTVISLLAENNDYERTLQGLRGDDPAELERTRQSIRKTVEENAKKIRELQEMNRALAIKEQETKDKIKKLERAIEANDFYSLLLRKIKDPTVSDDDLSLLIWSIRTVQGTDLDQLSEGRDVRLIEALINVSRPYASRPYGAVTYEYTTEFRCLGNLFVPGGLGWVGTPLDLRTCKHQGSQFERNSASVAQYAKDQLGKKR